MEKMDHLMAENIIKIIKMGQVTPKKYFGFG
jgi:hypothetical protein